MADSKKNGSVKKCACGCGEEATHPYVKMSNEVVLATRTCYEKYEKSHKPVYAPPQIQTQLN